MLLACRLDRMVLVDGAVPGWAGGGPHWAGWAGVSLEDGWVDRAKSSLKLTTTILQHLREGREKEVILDRFGTKISLASLSS